jgi:hypothetical protein
MKELDIKNLEQSPHLLDVLLQMEDVLDSLDIYVYRNWFEGDVVSGPDIRRHWLSMTLLYPISKKPDERASLRLIKHGIRVDFSSVTREKSDSDEELASESADADPASKSDEDPEGTHWMVRLDFPRRLVAQMTGASELEMYDDLVDADDAEDAQDSGVTDETGLVDDASSDASEQEMGQEMGTSTENPENELGAPR